MAIKQFKIDFYELTTDSGRPFEEIFDSVAALSTGAARTMERKESWFRLQRHFDSRDFRHGDIMRVRLDDPPVRGNAEGTEEVIAMLDEEGLAHYTAFSYHVPTKSLVLQRNANAASSERFIEYFSKFDEGAGIRLVPKIQPETLARLAGMRSFRKVKIDVARLDAIPASVGKGMSTSGVLKTAQILEAPSVEVTFKVGTARRGPTLNVKGAKEMIAEWLRISGRIEGTVRKLEISGQDEDGESDAFDVFLDRIVERGVVERGTDMDIYFKARLDEIRKAWIKWSRRV